jgi:hypothetical protein
MRPLPRGGRIIGLPLFRIKDDNPGLAMLVSRPARGLAVARDGLRYTNMYETRNETALGLL